MHAQVPYTYITLTTEALHWVHPNATVDTTSGCRIVPLVGSAWVSGGLGTSFTMSGAGVNVVYYRRTSMSRWFSSIQSAIRLPRNAMNFSEAS